MALPGRRTVLGPADLLAIGCDRMMGLVPGSTAADGSVSRAGKLPQCFLLTDASFSCLRGPQPVIPKLTPCPPELRGPSLWEVGGAFRTRDCPGFRPAGHCHPRRAWFAAGARTRWLID